MYVQRGLHCHHCGERTLHQQYRWHSGIHLSLICVLVALSILPLFAWGGKWDDGIWMGGLAVMAYGLPYALVQWIRNLSRSWVCQRCGSARRLRSD